MRPVNGIGPDAQQDIGGKERAEEHDFGGQKEPDANLGIEEAGVGSRLNCIGDVHECLCRRVSLTPEQGEGWGEG